MSKKAIGITIAIALVLATGLLIFYSYSRNNTQFRGHVAKGQTFQKDIGRGLVFQLVPYDDYGWKIEIVPKYGETEYDFTLITPPFHGPNPTDIQAWHFRNEDNTGPNDGIIAPQETRIFFFVLTKQDADTVADAMQQYEDDAFGGFNPDVPLGQGTLVIQDLKLSNLVPGLEPRVESMDFTVSFQIPSQDGILEPG